MNGNVFVMISRADLEDAIRKAAEDAASAVAKRMRSEREELWTAQQVADYLRVSPRTIAERYSARSDFPRPINISPSSRHRMRRWRAADVMAWVRNNGI